MLQKARASQAARIQLTTTSQPSWQKDARFPAKGGVFYYESISVEFIWGFGAGKSEF